jgi:hypothetical protein
MGTISAKMGCKQEVKALIGHKRISVVVRLNRLWGPPSLLSDWYRGLHPRECSVRTLVADH